MGKRRLKKFLCPVCDSFYFIEPTQEEIDNGLSYPLDEDFCYNCGWQYEESQLKDYDLKTQKNPLSINEQKKVYEQKIKEDPEYNYLDEIRPDPTPHPCPVCGKYIFEDVISHDICPYCGWEDDGLGDKLDDDRVSANGMTFAEYKQRYEDEIKKNPNYVWSKKLK